MLAAENWKIQTLPLARVKKIMKSEEIIMQELEKERLQKEGGDAGSTEGQERSSVKFMISGEAPILMSKACELLVRDLSFRAWQHTERNRRRTLQRQDLHAAVGESEVYDFLIDIVPRVQAVPAAPPPAAAPTTMNQPDMSQMAMGTAGLPPGMQVPQMGINMSQPAMPPQTMGGDPTPQVATQHLGQHGLGQQGSSLDSSNPQGGMIQFQAPDALHHLQWDPTHLSSFQQMQVPEGTDGQANTGVVGAPHQGHQNQQHHIQQPPPPPHQQQPHSSQQWVDPTNVLGGMGSVPPHQHAHGT